MRLEQGAADLRVREPRRARDGARSGRSKCPATARRIRTAAASRRSAIVRGRAASAFPTACIGACARTRRRPSRTAAITCSSPAPRRASVSCSRRRTSGACPSTSSRRRTASSRMRAAAARRPTARSRSSRRARRIRTPRSIALKPPEQWTLMGTEQKNLDIPMKVTGETKYAIDVRVPGMKWAAVKSCPVYGGDVKSYDFDAIRDKPGVRAVHQFPIPDPTAHARPRVQRRRRRRSPTAGTRRSTALDALPIEWTIPPERAAFNTANMRAALLRCARRARPRAREPRRRRRGLRARRPRRRSDVLDAVPAARSHGARQRDRARDRRARRHLDRRPEPAGDALQRRADHGHSRRERLSAHVPSWAAASAATATVRKPSRRS